MLFGVPSLIKSRGRKMPFQIFVCEGFAHSICTHESIHESRSTNLTSAGRTLRQSQAMERAQKQRMIGSRVSARVPLGMYTLRTSFLRGRETDEVQGGYQDKRQDKDDYCRLPL